jgi:hypothetical protein
LPEQVFSARRVPALQPGSPEWLRMVTASKMASIMRLNPKEWESRYSLWHRMKGNIPISVNEPAPEVVEAGNLLEPAIAEWWARRHPDYRVQSGGFWVWRENDRVAVSPDRMCQHRENKSWIPLEIKTARYEEDWGAEMSNDIPIHYLVQVLLQMIVLGVDEVAVCVLTAFFEFREYRVRREDFEDDIQLIRREAVAFLHSLDNDIEPDLIHDNSTYLALRHRHPEIIDEAIHCGPELAHELAEALRATEAAEDAMAAVKVKIADHMGQYRRLIVPPTEEGAKALKVGHRQTGQTPIPYFVANKRVMKTYTMEDTNESAS